MVSCCLEGLKRAVWTRLGADTLTREVPAEERQAGAEEWKGPRDHSLRPAYSDTMLPL